MKKRVITGLGILLIIFVILNLAVPSEDDYYEWLEDEYNIQESEELYYYTQEDDVIFDLSMHEKMFGIFTTRSHDFGYVSDEKTSEDDSPSAAFKEIDPEKGFTIRTLEIGTMILPMEKDNIFWKVLMK